MQNAIYSICPYHYQNQWVFDDERVDLVQEPFVMGIRHIIDKLFNTCPIPIRNSRHYLMTPVYQGPILFLPGNWKNPLSAGIPVNKTGCVAGFALHYINITR